MTGWRALVIPSIDNDYVADKEDFLTLVINSNHTTVGEADLDYFQRTVSVKNVTLFNSSYGVLISSTEHTNGTTNLITDKNYLALLLLTIPLITIVGNGLVVISICKEKMLHTTTNYLILSLAVADFLVALCVMPFAVYVEVEQSEWRLPKIVCNLYIAGDVCASTASILNLVAVSWDRYMAVSSPIQYAQNSRKQMRVKVTIFTVWFVSALTASPIMMGLNNLDRTVHCEFTDPLYIFVSSLISFYVPCVIILVLYTVVLKKLRRRKKRVALRKHGQQHQQPPSEVTTNGDRQCCQTDFDETTFRECTTTKTANGWITAEQTADRASTFGGERSSGSFPRPTYPHVVHHLFYQQGITMLPALYNYHDGQFSSEEASQNGDLDERDSFQNRILSEFAKSKLSSHCNGELIYHINHNNNNNSVVWLGNKNLKKPKRKKEKCKTGVQSKRDETRTSRKERKATQTLAIVLGVFLVCWLPFFICHLTNSVCKFRFNSDCVPMMAMFATTWLGYINSFLNPIIYTVFNPTYRKAFKRLFRRKRKRYV